jgi:predicted 2-oxoglutarate/Fe(II)-dependent dioxygenase YbiX
MRRDAPLNESLTMTQIENSVAIKTFPLIDPRLCASLVAASIETGVWHTGRMSEPGKSQGKDAVNVDGSVAVSEGVSYLFEKGNRELLESLRRTLVDALKPLTDRGGLEVFRLSDIQIVRYRPGGLIKAHRDSLADFAPWRRYSIVCNLNSEYDGGQTCFPTLDLRIEPEAGKAVLFPSYYLHEGLAVVRGEKFVLTVLLMDPVSSRGKE